MSIINDSHAIGIDSRNLVLKTRGALYVKVGSQYYEIDFRNLSGNKEDKEEESEKEYILTVESKQEIESLEYPGDNKLIVGLDGTLFVTKNNTVIDVTPKSTTIIAESIGNNLSTTQDVTSITSASVTGKLFGDEGYSFDFSSGEIFASSIVVENEIVFPNTTVKTRCCKTHSGILEDGNKRVVRKYLEYDFVEIVEIPDYICVKSGAMIKSNINVELPVFISGISRVFSFEENGLYIAYNQDEEVIITKLN